MKVVLVRPPFYSFFGRRTRFIEPLGLLYLASSLLMAGHDVALVDGEYSGIKYGRSISKHEKLFQLLRPFRMMPGHRHRVYNEAMSNPYHPVWYDVTGEIMRENPDVVGLTTYTATMTGVQYICNMLKEEMNTPIILGGLHATALPDRTLKETGADVIICGEGEQAITTAVNQFEDDQPVKNIVVASQEKNVDTIPFPARDLLDNYDQYGTNIITSRGCPFNCIFCSSHMMWGRKVRFRSPSNVLEEIDELVTKYAVRGIRICDDTFTVKKKHVLEICAGLRMRDYDMSFSCGTRADTMDRDIAKFLKNAKCHSVSMGVESGNEEMLKYMKKGITKEDVIRTIRILKEEGLRIYLEFILGFKLENLDTIRDTTRFMKSLDPDFAEINILTPYPGTDLWSDEYADIPWYKFFHQSDGLVSSDHLTKREMSRAFVKAYKTFALHSLKKMAIRKFFG